MKDPIDIAAEKISASIKKLNHEEIDNVEEMTYALSLTINLVMTIALILVIGHFTHAFQETLIALSFFGVLRLLAKGAHVKSLTFCVFVTTALIVPIPHIPVSKMASIILAILCVATILMKSQVNVYRKIIAVIIVILGCFLKDPHIELACMAQAITLYPTKEVMENANQKTRKVLIYAFRLVRNNTGSSG